MKKLLKLLTASALFLGLYALPAQAGWQYTEWGMSPDEVIAAANGKHQSLKYHQNTVLLGLYTVGEMHFKLGFGFNINKQLERVSLSLEQPVFCEDLRIKLLSTYGKELETSKYAYKILLWQDKNNNNLIKLIIRQLENDLYPESCLLDYLPLSAPNKADQF